MCMLWVSYDIFFFIFLFFLLILICLNLKKFTCYRVKVSATCYS